MLRHPPARKKPRPRSSSEIQAQRVSVFRLVDLWWWALILNISSTFTGGPSFLWSCTSAFPFLPATHSLMTPVQKRQPTASGDQSNCSRRRRFVTSRVTVFRAAHSTGSSRYSVTTEISVSRGDDSLMYGWANGNQRRRHKHQRQKQSEATSTMILYMGKGDGKKKRQKKSASDVSSTNVQQSTPARVSTNINIPVRQQIAWANLNKQYRAAQQGSFRQDNKKVARTKYRRTWEEEEIEQKAEERRRKGQDPDWSVILNRTAAAPPLLLVDGYNIIYKWPRLKKHMVRCDPGRARQLLVDDLENLASLKRWRIECVFDGTRRSTSGGPLGHTPTGTPKAVLTAAKKDVSKYGVRVVYTGVGIEADSYIEGRCREAKNVTEGALTGQFIVATDDVMIRLAGQNAGALCMSAERFVQELKAVKQAVDYRVEAAVAKVNGHSIRPVQLRGRNSMMQGRFKNSAVIIEKTKIKTDVQGTSNDGDEMDDDYGDTDHETTPPEPLELVVEDDGEEIQRGRKMPE